ncbi:unnamed protein product [Amoebophrya sp. A120]|nr:unnamed protein product [Amoebophrya sp. A120]|eukprot:GSA120T00021321001.1
MCTIEKLAIQGIRSFHFDEQQKIGFDRPVTLIVGQNGCGKTTIIECLKMASCGALPPNVGSGSAFIHDPKWARLQEVKGQIKMMFSRGQKDTPEERQLLCTRSFHSIGGGGTKKASYKAMDCTLQFCKGGTAEERTRVGMKQGTNSHTTRVSEMDQLVPQFMGVEKAILENVIFCHQEESNWPLMEQKTLKKKFDDIFGSTRYTRALQNITQVRQELSKKATLQKGQVQLLGSHQQEAHRLKAKIDQLQADRNRFEVEHLHKVTKALKQFQHEKQKREMVLHKFSAKKQEIEKLHVLVVRTSEQVAVCQKECEQIFVEPEGRTTREIVTDLEEESKDLTDTTIPELGKKKEKLDQEEHLANQEFQQVQQTVKQLRSEIGEVAAAGDLLKTRNERREELWRGEILTTVGKDSEQNLAAMLGSQPQASQLMSQVGASLVQSCSLKAVLEGELDQKMKQVLQRQVYNTVTSTPSAGASSSSSSAGVQNKNQQTLVQLQHHDGETMRALQQLCLKHGAKLQQLQKGQAAELEQKRQNVQGIGKKAQDARIQCESQRARERELQQRKAQLFQEQQNYQKVQREYEQVQSELQKVQQQTQTAGAETQTRKNELEREVAKLRKEKHDLQFSFQEKQDRIQVLEEQSKLLMEVEFLQNAKQEKLKELDEKKVQVKTVIAGLAPGSWFGHEARSSIEGLLSTTGSAAGGVTNSHVGGFSTSSNNFSTNNFSSSSGTSFGLPAGAASSCFPAIAEQCLQQAQKIEQHGNQMLATLRGQTDAKQKEHHKGISEKTYSDKEVERLGSGAARLRQELSAFTDLADFEQKLADVKERLEGQRSNFALIENGAKLYNAMEERSLKKDCCEMCKRPFANEAERQALVAQVAKLRQMIEKKCGAESGAKVKELEAELAAMENLKPKFAELQECQQKLGAEQENNTAKQKLVQEKQFDITNLQAEFAKLVEEQNSFKPVIVHFQQLLRMEEELRDAERNLRDKEMSISNPAALLGQTSAGTSQTAGKNELTREREELSALFEQSNQLERTLDQKQQQLNQLNEEEQRRRQRLTELQSRFQLLQEKMTRKEELQKQVANVEQELVALSANLQQLDSFSAQVQEQLKQVELECRNFENLQKQIVQFLERQQTELANKMQKLQELNTDIEKLEQKIRNAESVREELKRAELAVSEKEKSYKEKQQQKDEVVSSLADLQTKVFWLAKNLQLYRTQADCEKYSNELKVADDWRELRKCYEEVELWSRNVLREQESGNSGRNNYPPATGTAVTPSSPDQVEVKMEEQQQNSALFHPNNSSSGSDFSPTPVRSGNAAAASSSSNVAGGGHNDINLANLGDSYLPQPVAQIFQQLRQQNHQASSSSSASEQIGNLQNAPPSSMKTAMQQLTETEHQLAQQLQVKTEQAINDRGKIQGSLHQIGVEMLDAQRNLDSSLYQDIDERYRKAIIEEQSVKTAAQDCQKYFNSLDVALMKFHQEKMMEINFTMRSLWQEIYKGKDIEYVQIRSDAEDATGAAANNLNSDPLQLNEGVANSNPVQAAQVKRGGAGSRSYNYRLVMMLANGTELDMRGRCSAGQKVLASLITRLALADSFGCQCGILALDEPTTNLDEKNIEALAEALGSLIETRRDHSGFQLMIITHDETFVQMLSRKQVCERYWRVSKDPKKGTSIITQHMINTIDNS